MLLLPLDDFVIRCRPKPETGTCSASSSLIQSLLTRFPFRLTKPAGLQSLDHPERLFSRATNVQIVNYLIPKDTFGIDHKQTSKCDSLLVDQYAIVAGDGLGYVRTEWVLQTFDTTFIPRRL